MTSVSHCFAPIILIFQLMMCHASVVARGKFVVLFGTSQSGKSTFVRHMLTNAAIANTIRVGRGDGESVTDRIEIYTEFIEAYNLNLQMMDTPGSLDTFLRWTPEHILRNIEFAAITNTSSNTDMIDAVLVTESLADDPQQLKANLVELKKVFGDEIMRSVIVLGLKPTASRKSVIRVSSIGKQCRDLQLPFIVYETMDVDDNILLPDVDNDGYRELIDLILGEESVAVNGAQYQLRAYPMLNVHKTREKIKARALELMADAPKVFETVEEEIDHEWLEPYEVDEQYIDTRWGVIGHEDSPWPWDDGDDIYGWIPYTRTRKVTKYKPMKGKRKESFTVEVPKQFESFLALTKKEWEKQVLQSFGVNVHFKSEL